MLLVHDDEAEPLERREHGGARADHDVHVAAADALPLIVPLAVRERAVLDGDARAERAAEQRGHRRRQRDLGHHASAPAVPERHDPLGQAQIDLGLAAAGDAVQQRHAELARRPAATAARAPRSAPPVSVPGRIGAHVRASPRARTGPARGARRRIATRPCAARRPITSALTPRSRSSDSARAPRPPQRDHQGLALLRRSDPRTWRRRPGRAIRSPAV